MWPPKTASPTRPRAAATSVTPRVRSMAAHPSVGLLAPLYTAPRRRRTGADEENSTRTVEVGHGAFRRHHQSHASGRGRPSPDPQQPAEMPEIEQIITNR